MTDVTTAQNFFSSIYAKIVAEVKAVETDAVAVEAAVKAKIEAFIAGVSAELHSLHSGAAATTVVDEVKTVVADVEAKV